MKKMLPFFASLLLAWFSDPLSAAEFNATNYWKQFGGGPDAQMLEKMDPQKQHGEDSAKEPANKKSAQAQKQMMTFNPAAPLLK